ncbi:hypothetical protein CGRA01v4_13608 [Colletotrichum graminicola]|uniref:Uncharacterized protein n=1 Tax=Colletotrichum graminicola (strain M1.001 / M2 / FGSC 10212) TaxID=645133 RepID=E3QRK9_COLGM|nr:uncharacterized protein GLRG_08776 [Colletotrichum graminicola M1.001]EFQ33497.1 hypothetical protein GLRG_08776 [Colletotrichum graminicola M1.001]WDK22318.1 hypothetical protein CGRA01v4_13608 [Colletotrichum graminicola]
MGRPIKLGVPKVPEDEHARVQSTQPTNDQSHSQTEQATGAGGDTGAGTTRPKTEAELEADRLYEEAIEEEYAKRDGGS